MNPSSEFPEENATGQERNPVEVMYRGNETVKEMTDYEVVGGKPAYAGFTYQLKLLMLFFCWGETSRHFRLATEIQAAGKFDDLLFEYENEERKLKYVLVQAKHSTKKQEKAINMEALKNVKNGAYSFQKYFSSFMAIRKGGQISPDSIQHIILFTNVNFHESLLKRKFLQPIQKMNTFFHCETKYDIEQFYEFTSFPEELLHLMVGTKTPDVNQMKCLEEFRGKLIFAVNQPDEQDIERIITEWLGNNFNLTNCEFIFAQLLSEMTKWMASPVGSFRTNEDKAVFLKKIKSEMEDLPIFGVYSEKAEKKNKTKFFEDESLEKLKKFLDEGKYMRLFSNEVSISCMKVIQILQHELNRGDYVVINVEDMLVLRRHLMKSLKAIKQFFLVIEWSQVSQNQARNDERFIWEILKEAEITKNEFRIVTISLVKDFDDDYDNEWTRFNDSFAWENLTENAKQKVRKYEITFNGHAIQLSSLLTDLEFEKFNATGKIVNEIIEEKEIVMGKEIHESGQIRNYYIPRSFRLNVKGRFDISKNCFVDIPDTELFVISGFENDEFDNFFDSVRVVYYNETCEIDNIKVILLEDDGNQKATVMKIGKFCPLRNVHWLIKKGNEFQLKMTIGDSYLDEVRRSQQSRINVVYGTAGIGKSTVLTHIGENIQKMKPSLWVVRFNLIKYAAQFSKIKSEKDAIEFLSEVDEVGNAKSEIGKKLFKFCLKETGNVVLLLDGFDEICPDNEIALIQMVEFYKQMKVAQIWITTRTQFKDSLGTNYAYELVPFSDRDQEMFFRQFWVNTLNCEQITPINHSKVSLFVKNLLRLIKDSTKDCRQELVGNALQAMLIANSYMQEFLVFHNASSDSAPKIQTAFGIALYRKFVNNKFSVYIEEKIGTSMNMNTGNQVMKELVTSKPIIKAVIKYHQKLALALLFPKRYLQFFEKNITMPDASIIRIGIIENIGDGYRFIHRTFAEFFLAELLTKIIMKRSSKDETRLDHYKNSLKRGKYEIAKSFLFDELLNPINKMLQRFLDKILIPKSKIFASVLRGDHEVLRSLIQRNHLAVLEKDGLGRTLLHWACVHSNYDIVKDIYFSSVNLVSTVDDLGFAPLIYAAATGKIKIIEFLLSKVKEQKDCPETLKKFFTTIIHSTGLDLFETQDCIPKWLSRFNLYDYLYLPDEKDHWVTLFLSRSKVLGYEHVPGIFYLVDITTQHQMLAMGNYKLIKKQLVSCKPEKLNLIWESFLHSGINTDAFHQIQDDISQLEELESCFCLSVKEKNYSMLAILIKYSSKEKQKELWLKKDWVSISKDIFNNLAWKSQLQDAGGRATRHIVLLGLLRVFDEEAIFDYVPWFQFFSIICSDLNSNEILYYVSFLSRTLLERVLQKHNNEVGFIIQFKTKGLYDTFCSILHYISDNSPNKKQKLLSALKCVKQAEHHEFLTCFWTNKIHQIGEDCTPSKANEDRVIKFVEKIVANEKLYFSWSLKRLIGENLILDLIAGAFEEQARCFCEKKFFQVTIIPNIVQLYDNFLTNKCLHYTKHKDIQKCFKEHQHFAFHLLFPEKAEYILKSKFQKPSEQCMNIGLISYISGKYCFMYPTFAEYLVAKYIFKILSERKTNKKNSAQFSAMKEFLVEEILKENNETLRVFLDHHLAQDSKVHQFIVKNDWFWDASDVFSKNIKDDLKTEDLLGRTVHQFICLYDSGNFLYEKILNYDKSLINKRDSLNFSPICYAFASGDCNKIKTCMELSHNCKDIDISLQPVVRILNFAPTSFKLTYLAYWICKYNLQKSIMSGGDNYVEMFLEKLRSNKDSKVPNVFFVVDIATQHKMLTANNYGIVKESLRASHKGVLWQIAYGLNKGGMENDVDGDLREIKLVVSSLPELKKCFAKAISCDDFDTLEALVHLIFVEERKSLYEMNNYRLLFDNVSNDNKKVFTITTYENFYSCRQIIMLDLLSLFPDDNMFKTVNWFRFFSLFQMCKERYTGNVIRYLSLPLITNIFTVLKSNKVFMSQFKNDEDSPLDFILEYAKSNQKNGLVEILAKTLKNVNFWCYDCDKREF